MKNVNFVRCTGACTMIFYFITGCAGNSGRGRSSDHVTSREGEGRQLESPRPAESESEAPYREWEIEDKTDEDTKKQRETPSRVAPDRQALIAEFRTKSNELRSCYEKGLKANPKLAGKVLVDIVVKKTGNVEKVEIVESRTTLHAGKGTPQVIEDFLICIQKSLKDMIFSSLKDVGGKIRYPFVFRPNSP